MKNPSTATAQRSDPTLGKVTAWASRRGYNTLVVVNLFAFRATEPAELNAVPYAAAVGPDNDRWLRAAAAEAADLVAGWGNANGITPERYARRLDEVLALLRGRRLWRVGPLTALGHPRHGLRWNQRQTLRRFDFSARDDKLS